MRYKELKKGAIILLEDKWRTDPDPEVAKAYKETYDPINVWKHQLISEGLTDEDAV